jgi:hypothetical protein
VFDVGLVVGFDVGLDVGLDVGVFVGDDVGDWVGDDVIAELHLNENVPDPVVYASTMKYARCVTPWSLIHVCG